MCRSILRVFVRLPAALFWRAFFWAAEAVAVSEGFSAPQFRNGAIQRRYAAHLSWRKAN